MWAHLVTDPNFITQLMEETAGSIALTVFFQRTTVRSLKAYVVRNQDFRTDTRYVLVGYPVRRLYY